MDTETPEKHTPKNSALDGGVGWKQEHIAEKTIGNHGVQRPGPGRKSRACKSITSVCIMRSCASNWVRPASTTGVECKKQKMKCEVLPGDRKCRNCLRRGTECMFKRVVMSEVIEDKMSSQAVFNYELAVLDISSMTLRKTLN